jgi:hypothetical protein
MFYFACVENKKKTMLKFWIRPSVDISNWQTEQA